MASVPPLIRQSILALNGRFASFNQLLPLHTSLKLPFPFHRTLVPAVAVPVFARAAFANVQDALSSIWESILLAVPKKKTSYSKKRSRQLAGKALKDVTSLNRCSSCGRPKRAHFLCSHCVILVKDIWNNNTTSKKIEEQKAAEAKAVRTARAEPKAIDEVKADTKPPSLKERFQSMWHL